MHLKSAEVVLGLSYNLKLAPQDLKSQSRVSCSRMTKANSLYAVKTQVYKRQPRESLCERRRLLVACENLAGVYCPPESGGVRRKMHHGAGVLTALGSPSSTQPAGLRVLQNENISQTTSRHDWTAQLGHMSSTSQLMPVDVVPRRHAQASRQLQCQCQCLPMVSIFHIFGYMTTGA